MAVPLNPPREVALDCVLDAGVTKDAGLLHAETVRRQTTHAHTIREGESVILSIVIFIPSF